MSMLINAIRERAETHPDAPAFMWQEHGTVCEKTNAQFFEDVKAECGMHQYKANDNITITSGDNSYEFICSVCSMLMASEEGQVIFYTSGSTSRPKAVLIKLSAIEGNIASILPYFFYKPEWKVYIPVPYCHVYGFTSFMAFFIGGCTIVLGSSRTLKKDMNTFKPEIVIAVPSIITYMLKKKLLNSSVKNIMTASGICSTALEKQVRALDIGIQNHYGSSELPFGVAMSAPEGPVDVLVPQHNVTITIAEDNEILLASPYLFSEYYESPNETAAVLKNGVFYTGDIGTLDKDGNLHLAGRKKDYLILDNGEKIFCPEVDEILQSFPGVADAAAVLHNNLLSAAIFPESKELIPGIEAALSQYNQTQPMTRQIQQIILLEAPLQRTSTGKIILSQRYIF